MDAPAASEVQGKLSAVPILRGLPRPQAQQARRQELADLPQPLLGGHQVRVEGVGQGRDVVGEVRADVTSSGFLDRR
jgi:hypothetical protein